MTRAIRWRSWWAAATSFGAQTFSAEGAHRPERGGPDGNARHPDERPCAPKRHRESGPAGASPERDRNPEGRGELHSPTRRAPHGKGPRRRVRRWDGQPLLHHRYGRRPARSWRSRPTCSSRRLSWTASTTATRVRTPMAKRYDTLDYSVGDREPPWRDGPDRVHHVSGTPASPRRFGFPQSREPRGRPRGRSQRHPRRRRIT